MDKKTKAAAQKVIDWMYQQMYVEHTEWTCGDEHDLMREAYDLLNHLVNKEGQQ